MKFLDSNGLAYFWQKVKAAIEEQAAAMPSGGGLPAGSIVIWSGAADAVPDGWTLCDGTNGVPDLRGQFVLGAGGTYAPGDAGGCEEVKLTVDQIPSHYHMLFVTDTGHTGSGVDVLGRGKADVYTNTITGVVGGSKAHTNMPPYYALCYIMKL